MKTREELPPDIVIGALRWQLQSADSTGRGVVSWLAAHWAALSQQTQQVLLRDLAEARDEAQDGSGRDAVIVSAVRYYLGRSTAAVGGVCDWLVAMRGQLAATTRKEIVAAIREAQAAQRLGMAVDAAGWAQVLDSFGEMT